MQQVPSGLLLDPERSGNLTTRYTVATVGDHPDADEPLIEPERGVLEDRADFDRELLSAALFAALEQATALDLADIRRTAFNAADITTGPLETCQVVMAALRIGEVSDGFDECLRLTRWCILDHHESLAWLTAGVRVECSRYWGIQALPLPVCSARGRYNGHGT